jgi:hypothetical protein
MVTFSYLVDCRFDKDTDEPVLAPPPLDANSTAPSDSDSSSMDDAEVDEEEPPEFHYFVNTTSFAVSLLEENTWTMALRVFDFVSFSDLTASLFQVRTYVRTVSCFSWC